MGMAATQARYLSLVAQKSNLEYQGQQINQERAVLSQQVSELYNSLLNMQVPTPPSTQDYTKVEYQGAIGATKFNIPAANIKPGKDGKYCVTFEKTTYGDYLSLNNGYSSVKKDEENSSIYYVAGAQCYTIEEARNAKLISEEVYDGFKNAILNAFPQGEENSKKPEDFYIFQDTDENWHFALIEDVTNGDSTTITYNYIPNGEFTLLETENPCGLTFETGSGRITSVQIPVYKDGNKDSEILSWMDVKLEAVSVTDELAYEEAMSEYEYEQYQYDKKQQEINAKTAIIQEQDRNLELKLQRLDTQRQQIDAETEALEKVLGDNIDKSYKTFSG